MSLLAGAKELYIELNVDTGEWENSKSHPLNALDGIVLTLETLDKFGESLKSLFLYEGSDDVDVKFWEGDGSNEETDWEKTHVMAVGLEKDRKDLREAYLLEYGICSL